MNKIPCGGFELDDSLVMENGKLGVAPGASVAVDSELSDTSTNPVQNKVVKAALDAKQSKNFVINFSQDSDGSDKADKTFAELSSAISAGASISAVYGQNSQRYLTLIEFVAGTYAMFGYYYANFDGGMDFITYMLRQDDTVTSVVTNIK